MTKDEFNKLDLKDQVNYINELKISGLSMKRACSSIGIASSTFSSRLKGKYKLENDLYVPLIEIIYESNTKVLDKEIKSNTEVVYETMHKSNTEVTPQQISQSNTKVVSFEDINYKDFQEMLLNYKSMNNKLDEVYNWYESQSNTKVVSFDKLEIGDFEGDIVTRSYKLYSSIQKEFAEFCKENNKFKVQDILSQSLREFMDKYK